MNWRQALGLCGACLLAACAAQSAQAQVVVVGGVPSYGVGYGGYGTTVVVGRPVVPAVSLLPAPVAPTIVASPYLAPQYTAGYGVHSTYRPVVPTTYVAPVVTYRPVVPAYVPLRTGVVTSRVYVPGQPVRNALRVVAP